jgi:tetratricopeptide (TPR) repeat protein
MSYTELHNLKKSWIAATENGNKHFQQEQFNISKSLFEQAMQIAELLFRHAQDADSCGMPVVSAFNVSCINLARNFREIGDIKTAGEYFLYNVWNLKQLSLQIEIRETLRQEAMKNWENAVMALEEFYEQTGQALTVDFRNGETYEQIGLAKRQLIHNKTLLN